MAYERLSRSVAAVRISRGGSGWDEGMGRLRRPRRLSWMDGLSGSAEIDAIDASLAMERRLSWMAYPTAHTPWNRHVGTAGGASAPDLAANKLASTPNHSRPYWQRHSLHKTYPCKTRAARLENLAGE